MITPKAGTGDSVRPNRRLRPTFEFIGVPSWLYFFSWNVAAFVPSSLCTRNDVTRISCPEDAMHPRMFSLVVAVVISMEFENRLITVDELIVGAAIRLSLVASWLRAQW